MQNAEVARCFADLADLLEIDGANPFRVRAYRNAARTIEDLAESASGLVDDGKAALTALPGIGEDLAGKIITVVETGRLPQLEELQAKTPKGVVEMLRIPGLGPKKVAALFRDLNISSLDQLRAAAQAGELAALKGFGKKTAESILAGLDQLETSGRRTLLADAMAEVDEIAADLSALASVEQISAAGSCRRRKETCGDLDVWRALRIRQRSWTPSQRTGS